jgi:hypothetical protein
MVCASEFASRLLAGQFGGRLRPTRRNEPFGRNTRTDERPPAALHPVFYLAMFADTEGPFAIQCPLVEGPSRFLRRDGRQPVVVDPFDTSLAIKVHDYQWIKRKHPHCRRRTNPDLSLGSTAPHEQLPALAKAW